MWKSLTIPVTVRILSSPSTAQYSPLLNDDQVKSKFYNEKLTSALINLIPKDWGFKKRLYAAES